MLDKTSGTAGSMQDAWLNRAKAVLPAGGFGNFDPSIVVREGHGARVWDENGKEYVDYLISSGPMILGHDHPEVIEAVREQLGKGMTFFASNARGIELAEVICQAVPCAEQLRYLSTGGEADMYALRLARAHTGRDKILKFEGGYHGMSAEAMISIFPDRLENFPNGIADSAGLPARVRESVLVAPFNDEAFVRQILAEHGDEIAAVIVEPLQRLVPPEPGFLEALREETSKRGIVLIFDEIVTGFRLAYGGAQERYGVVPDLCTLGKIVGGGFPLAVVAGKAEIMAHFDKAAVGRAGFTPQIGTLSGNPVAAVAGLKTLEILRRAGSYEQISRRGEAVMAMLRRALDPLGVAYQIVGDPVLFDVVFSARPVRDYRGVAGGDQALSARFNALLRERGILKPASKIYASLALTEADMAWTEDAIAHAAAHLLDS
ncbi:aspartate aminotransferase family protein [Nitratireductor alexandrii]|uniref:aspartate aminotransferase family protein n=1 Tax=Nitratireductor alexandrii TaxID=2448161 RepID=UPI001EE8AC60|nr:aminotransferase class III-fold pyridoxal phosphate-dependent enzyme [Nitratireductor alexandrii]